MQYTGTWSRIRSRTSLAGVLLTTALALTGCGSSSNTTTASTGNADPSIVQTVDGAVQGTVTGTGRSFLGIPYAAPPVGDLRWKAPQAPAAWSGTRDATQFGSRCPQFATPLENAASDNEDCLYLNVYTPPVSSTKKPVMLWFHGGSFAIGSGNDYPGDVLSATGDVVVVTINYRIGPFGYLALSGLASEDANGSTGNYGSEDQLASLQWVHANIARFGGDPNNVTIFGESAGGMSACIAMASPLAKGLFHKAIVESGSCMSAPSGTLSANESFGKNFAARAALGCTNLFSSDVVSCMRGKSTDDILNAETPYEQQAIEGDFAPTVDGYLLPQSPEDAITSGNYNKVPVINGSNHDEGKLFVALIFDLFNPPATLDTDNYEQALQTALTQIDPGFALLGPILTPLIVSEYPLSNYPAPGGFDSYYTPAHSAVAAVLTDAGFACPAVATDELLVNSGQPFYAYEFSDPNPPVPFTDPYIAPPMAGHASELVYVFQAPLEGGAVSPSMFSADQMTLSTQMMHYWTNFARSGNPNGDGLPQWSQYTSGSPTMLTLAPDSGGGIGPLTASAFKTEHQCADWGTP